MINDNADKIIPQAESKAPARRFPEFRNSPPWQKTPLDSTGKIVTGKTPDTGDDTLWNGKIAFVTPTDIDGSKYQYSTNRFVNVPNSRALPVGSIMYTCIASIGKMSITTKPSITNQQINSIIVENYHNEFVYYALANISSYIKSTQANTTLPIINKTTFAKFTIFVPVQNKEQEKIAACLSSVDNLISTKQTELESLKKYKKGLLQQLFPQGNNNFPALRFPEFKNMWIADKIINIADYVDYRGKTPEKVSQGIFLVTAKNIKMGYIDYNASQEYVSRDDYEIVMRRGLPEIGDVLITTEAPLGNIASVDRKDVAFAQRVIKYRGKENILHNPFLKYIMLSDDFQKKIDNLSTGGTAKGIKGSTLHEIKIRFTSSWTEQKKIADCLTSLDSLIELKQQELNKLSHYKKGLLQQLLVQG